MGIFIEPPDMVISLTDNGRGNFTMLNKDDARHPRSQKFHQLLELAGQTHDRKQRDYGIADDPFRNLTASGDFGVEPWIGVMIRLNDKVNRLKTFATTGQLANEGALDSLMDIGVYALIAHVLLEEKIANES